MGCTTSESTLSTRQSFEDEASLNDSLHRVVHQYSVDGVLCAYIEPEPWLKEVLSAPAIPGTCFVKRVREGRSSLPKSRCGREEWLDFSRICRLQGFAVEVGRQDT